MAWEYTTIMIGTTGFLGGKLDSETLTSRLNELGAVGWELVSTFDTSKSQGQTRDVVAILKRPLSKR
jgi:hypothetical protein